MTRSSHVGLIFSAVLGMAAPAAALDPAHAPSQYVIRKWGADALRGNTVHAVLQTRDRYLWIGTNAGLVRYDGSRFVLFNARNTPELGDGGASTLSEGPKGDLFIGTTSGEVVRYVNGAFEKTSIPAGTARTTSVRVDRKGTVWSSTFGNNVSTWKDGAVLSEKAFIAQGAGVILEDPIDGVWIGTRDKGLAYVKGENEAQILPLADAVQALAFDHDGVLWVGTAGGLLRRKSDGTLERIGTEGGLTSANVTAILEDRDRNLWVGTAGGGLNRLTKGQWTHISRSFDALSDDDVRSLIEDHEGNVWVGTADGLNRLSNGTFVTYGSAEGLAEDVITAVAPGRDGVVWAGTDTGHVLRWSGGKVERFIAPDLDRGRDAVLALHEAADGATWLALDSRRLFRLKDGRFTAFRASSVAQPGTAVRAFFDGENGELQFFITTLGLARLDPKTQLFTPVISGTAKASGDCKFPRFPHRVFRDGHGTFWFADRCGLASYKDGAWSILEKQHGLPADRVRWVIADANDSGAMWVATAAGLAYVRGGVVKAVTLKDGLPEAYLRVVLDDGRGSLWVASTGNLFRLDKRELHDFFEGRLKQVNPRVYDTADGLRTTEILLSNNPGFAGADGRLWFATGKGMAMVDPARVPTNAEAPAVHIEEVSIDEKAYDPRRTIEAPPGTGDLTVRYTGLSFTMPERVRFRYMLEGHDRRWIDAADRRAAFYTNLRPGPYKFRVTACNNDGVWSEQGSGIDLYIAPHFYQTKWFMGIGVLLALSAVAAVHQGRVRYLKAREKVLSRRVEEAVAQVKALRGLLPICASCKKIRDDGGYWNQIETYIHDHSDAEFSHSVCPDCLEKLYPEYASHQAATKQ
jgi:ligand-binding sensor domain-containing protein